MERLIPIFMVLFAGSTAYSIVDKDSDTLKKATVFIASIEKFKAKAYHDRSQYSNGYGTKAKHKREIITEKVAQLRLLNATKKHFNVVRDIEGLTDSQRVAFTSFSYNIGISAFKRSSVYKALKQANIDKAVKYMKKYVYSNKRKLKGLEKRRLKEIKLIKHEQ